MTPVAFKRSIRDLQVWCSSCMVAFSGSDPIGVLIGAKRPSGTLVHKIAVHPDHVRQGHGRHLLASLGSKLAILGPPRMIAEVPETLAATCGLFSASGYVQEALLTDYVLQREENDVREVLGAPEARPVGAERGAGAPASERAGGSGGAKPRPGSTICCPVRDPGHDRRSRRQWSPWRGSSAGLLGALGRDPHGKEGRHRRTRRRLRRANRGLPPLRGARSGGDGDYVAALFHRGRWSPSEATALSTQAWGPSGSRRSTRRRSQRSSWRRSVSAPPAGIYSTQRGRGPTRPRSNGQLTPAVNARPECESVPRTNSTAWGSASPSCCS